MRRLVTSIRQTDGGDDEIVVERRAGEVVSDPPAQATEAMTELDKVGELVIGATGRERWMIPILLSAPRVAARRLQMALGIGSDPHPRPRRRYGQPSDPRDVDRVGRPTRFVDVHEPFRAAAPDARLDIRSEADHNTIRRAIVGHRRRVPITGQSQTPPVTEPPT